MNLFLLFNYAQKKLLFVFLLIIFIIVSVGLYYHKQSSNDISPLTCRGNVTISNNGLMFKGILDFKTDAKKGIANISGYVTDVSGEEYLIQRTVFFSSTKYGISPVWTSEKIGVSDIETAPFNLLVKILPIFYLQPSTTADIDVLQLSKDAWIITKSSMPYLYCQQYKL